MAKDKDIAESQHYVQQAYQKGFFDDGKTNFWILDKSLPVKPNGEIENNLLKERGARVCFEGDFFYASNYYKEKDFLEKNFFGPIDADGAEALSYMLSEDKHILPSEEIGMTLLRYISAQKFRTPKGLELIEQSVPGDLTRENLLEILQQVHENMTITLAESAIEILDASSCKTKFIVSDAPVIEWNRYASQADADLYLLKGTRVIFPISKDFCLVSTPRELAEGNLTKKNYLEPRINARKYGEVIFDIRKLQNLRDINDNEVCVINKLIKDHALRYIAGGKKDYLDPPANASEIEPIIMPKKFKRSRGIAREINGKMVGVNEYGMPLEGKELEGFNRFMNWIKERSKKK
ncbi:MAG TPA: DUF4238 domain-containing protein [Candidatus Moranbacteria bacterium]|nr:DUF4238 domain-containing protein [Candidatus Moranbacteria bacterium]